MGDGWIRNDIQPREGWTILQRCRNDIRAWSGADGVGGRFGDAGGGEGFAALAAGGALAAVLLAAAVAGVGVGEVLTELGAGGGYFRLGAGDEGTQNLQIRVGAVGDSGRHGCHELLPAVGVDGVVATVGGDDQPFGTLAFGNAGGNGQENAVAEGDNCLLHVLLGIAAGGNGIRSAQQGTFQMRRDGAEVDFVVGHAAVLSLPAGAVQLAGGVVAAVVEGKGADHLVVAQRPVQGGGGIQPAGEENSYFHAGRFSGLCSASQVS